MKSGKKQPDNTSDEGLLLPGLDGANPLGFLASLGVLRAMSGVRAMSRVSIAWEPMNGCWVPRLFGAGQCEESLSKWIAEDLRVPFTADENAEAERKSAQDGFDTQQKRLKVALDLLKTRKLRGAERQQAERDYIDPIRNDVANARTKWLKALRKSIPSQEMSLGKHLNATCNELREAIESSLQEATVAERESADLYAAFGSDASTTDGSQMQATPFCFTTGSGHQYFLDTARKLFGVVTSDRINDAIFARTEPMDEKLSLRWDPIEDRRYAVMWSDPTASGNKAKTNWARNLLAYRGLQFFTCVPSKTGLNTVGWNAESDVWTWPVWTVRLTDSVVRSLLTHPALSTTQDAIGGLGSLGVSAVFRCQRTQVGNPPLHKINFGPARNVG